MGLGMVKFWGGAAGSEGFRGGGGLRGGEVEGWREFGSGKPAWRKWSILAVGGL